MFRSTLCSTAILLMIAVLPGCNSKESKPVVGAPPGANNAAPGSGASKYISGQNTTGAPAASPQDQAAVRAAATKIISQMENGDFTAIYADASDGFKKLGAQALFVEKFSQTRKKTGQLTNPQEINFSAGAGNTYVIVYRLNNERFQTDRRLSFSKTKDGKMILEGLNQHDEPKK